MLNADLHSHSTFSDGTLEPGDLVRRARAKGIQLFSLTDHDHLGGLSEAASEAADCGIEFVPGVEVSVSWDDHSIHVVGLAIDPENAALQKGLEQVRSGRDQRARDMAAELERVGIRDAYEGAMRHCANPALLGRSHFARYIVERGFAPDTREVFERYLVPGKPGFVNQTWAGLDEALHWIVGAGGLAVLAHPARYRISDSVLRRLIEAFRAGGGRGIEVCSGAHDDQDIRRFSRIAREYGLLASRASDFHSPDEGGVDLGGAKPLPAGLQPVWEHLGSR